jgi:hypothetical protein
MLVEAFKYTATNGFRLLSAVRWPALIFSAASVISSYLLFHPTAFFSSRAVVVAKVTTVQMLVVLTAIPGAFDFAGIMHSLLRMGPSAFYPGMIALFALLAWLSLAVIRFRLLDQLDNEMDSSAARAFTLYVLYSLVCSVLASLPIISSLYLLTYALRSAGSQLAAAMIFFAVVSSLYVHARLRVGRLSVTWWC